jgi:hypothetical protein
MRFTYPERTRRLIDLCPNVTDGLLALGSAAQVRPEVTTAPRDMIQSS